ncbi:MAG: type VI secretion system tube protein Hcp, partial [Betaproteobacteria bacterium]
EQDSKGATQSSSTGWDFATNTAVSGVTPVPDEAKQIPADSVAPNADLHYFVKIEGGDWLDLDSFSMGLQNTGSIGSGGGGGGSGKASADNVVLNLGSGATILELTHDLASGAHLKSIEIEAYASGGSKGLQLVDEFKYDDVLLTKLDTAGTANQVSFDFASFTHGHVEQDAKGGTQSDVTGWDFNTNTALTGSNPLPDAAKAVTESQVSAGADLDYYVHFDGADGWLRLDSFSMGLSNSGSISSGSGGGTGKSVAQDVHLLLGSSAEILALTDALDKGTHLKNVEIESYASGGDKGPQLVDEFKFNDVLVNSLDTTNASTNALTFDFASFTHGHVEQDSKGATQSSSTGWDFAHNIAVTAPLPHADVDLFS